MHAQCTKLALHCSAYKMQIMHIIVNAVTKITMHSLMFDHYLIPLFAPVFHQHILPAGMNNEAPNSTMKYLSIF